MTGKRASRRLSHPAPGRRLSRGRDGGDGGRAAEAGAAAIKERDDDGRAPPGGSAEARAATMVVHDGSKRSAMSREQVAKSRS